MGDDLDENRKDPLRPPHSRKFAQHTREWAEACDRAFCRAMRAEWNRRHRTEVSPDYQHFIQQTLRINGAT